MANHLSILEDEAMRELGEKAEIDDAFPDEHILASSHDLIPWFAGFANYLASDIVPFYLSFHQRKKFMYYVKISFGMSLSYTGVVQMGLFDVVHQNLRC